MGGKIPLAVLLAFVAIGFYFGTLPVPDELPNPGVLRAGAFLQFLVSPLPENWRCFALKAVLMGAQWEPITRKITDTVFDGVPVRIYEPLVKPKSPLPAIVYIHGGGWILFDIDFYHSMVNNLATEIDNVVIISVEYRLAPKHPFPAATDDCTTAVEWLLNHAKDYDIDVNRVAVLGDSAGGNLAASVAQRLTFDPKYKGLPATLKLQGLIYPCLQAFDFNLPSYQQHGHHQTVPLQKRLMVYMWSLYLQGNGKLENFFATNNHTSIKAKRSATARLVSHDFIPDTFKYGEYVAPQISDKDFGDVEVFKGIKDILYNPDFAPLMREDLKGLPETYVLTSQFDILRDDGIIYAKRLEKAGVKVTWNNYDVGVHGMMTSNIAGILKLDVALQATKDLVEFFKKNL